MKIRAKILSGFLVVTLIAVIIGVVGLVSSETMGKQSRELKLLQQEDSSIVTVLKAHYTWRQGLVETLLTGQEFTGSLDPTKCALGQWFTSEEAQRMTDPQLMEMLKKIEAPHTYIHQEAGKVVDYVKAGDTEKASEYLQNNIFPKAAEVISILSDMDTRYVELIDEKDQHSIQQAANTLKVQVVLILLALIVCILLALYLSDMISKPLMAITDYMSRASSTGDLSIDPDSAAMIGKLAQGKDELSQLSNASAAFVGRINWVGEILKSIAGGNLKVEVDLLSDRDEMGSSLKTMTENLNEMFWEIKDTASQVSTGSNELADGAQALAQGATDQAASIEELSGNLTLISEKTNESADTADKTAQLAETIKENAEIGARQMDEMMAAVKHISEASQAINNVMKTIDDIAFQTNILALNAAVEAARAGDAGKGFAVVAEEVRKLAGKSAESAKDTDAMIQNSIEKAELGVRIAGETATSLSEIVAGINESTQLIAGIAKSSVEQSRSLSQITIEIDNVAQVVQQNTATAQQSAAASEEMNRQAAMLQSLISRFEIKE